MRAVAFDLGNTLMSYTTPLSWQTLYGDALRSVLRSIDERVEDRKVSLGESVLLKYNTRVNYREHEVSSDVIFAELLQCWSADTSKIETAKEAFYSFFQQDAIFFPDVVHVLKELKRKGFKIGVLTDVAYGAERRYALRHAEEINFYADVLLTSLDVGFRKPNPAGYLQLARELHTNVNDCLFVGDEDKDIVGANRVGMTSVLIARQGQAKDFGQVHSVQSLNEIINIAEDRVQVVSTE